MRNNSSSPLRVLVVDDCQDNRESLGMVLQAWGHQVHLAHAGPSALGASQVFRPHAILLDLRLPGMDGWEVARRLRREDCPAPLLVAVTGSGREADRARSRAAGFDAHLTKPADLEELQRLLATAVSEESRAERGLTSRLAVD